MFGKIGKPYWDDKPVAVVGGGPSLINFDFEWLRGAHVLAVKELIFGIPWADAGFGLDAPRFNEWRDRLANVQARVYWALPQGEITAPPSKNVTFLKRLDGQSLSDDPSEIYGGGSSGFAAMQICIHKRAKRIVLFGFDYDGERWEKWAEHFRVYVPYLTEHGISVHNACPTSQIRCFQKVSLPDGVNIVRHV